MGSRHLILGAIEGYSLEQIEPFFASLRAAGYTGDVTIFCRDIAESTLEKLRGYGARCLPLSPRGLRNPWSGRQYRGEGSLGRLLPWVSRGLRLLPVGRARRERWLLRLAERFYHIANARFALAHAYLRQHGDSYGQVMITDVRDVYFQADPFAPPFPGELCTFCEHPGTTLRTNRNYREWIAATFGAETVARYLDARLSCCAITMGPAESMQRYLGTLSRMFAEAAGAEVAQFGCDSAVHNVALWEHRVGEIQTLENFHGPVLTMGTIPAAELRSVTGPPLRNVDGSVIPILHQLDRHAGLLERIVMARGKAQPAARGAF